MSTTDIATAVRVIEGRSEATRLRSLRVRKRTGLSGEKMAALVGVDGAALWRWERGTTKPGSLGAERWLSVIEALEEAFPSDEPAGHTTQVLADQAS